MIRSKALLYSLALSGAGAVLTAQNPPVAQNPQSPTQPSVTFRVGVDYVEIDARVTDARGQFVRGLNAEDFQVVEDGQTQQVSVFSLVEVPREFDDRPLYRTTPVSSDVFTNERPFAGRMYMIILDDLHVDVRRTGQVRRAGRQFIERYMSANDMAAVIHVAQPAANQEFTTNKYLLTQSIEKFTGQKLKSPTLNKLSDFLSKVEDPELREKPPQDNDMGLRSNWAQTTMQSLQHMSRYVSRMQGRRKAFLFFSEGVDYDLQSPMFDSFSGIPMGSDAGVINLAMREVFVDATRANVSIYPIDPRGLAIGIEEVVSMPSTMQPTTDPVTGEPLPSFGIDRVLAGLRFELDGALDVLRTMANETGGVAAINTNDLDGPFRRIVDDSSNYYLLGYYPTNRSRNGAFRRVNVNVKTPGLEVRARRGYFAPRPTDGAAADAEDPLVSMLASPVPTTGLTMRAAAQAIKGPSETGAVHLVVDIPAGQVPFQEVEGHFGNELVVTYEAVDATGVRRGANRHTAKFTMKEFTYDQVNRHGISLTTQFSLPPGQYQLRIGARERLTGRTGSVYADLEVPAFLTARLAMSDLTLSTPRFGFGFSLVNDTERLPRVLPAPPTTRREFERAEPLAAYAEIYSNDRRPHTVDLEARLTTEDGREVFRAVDHKQSKELAGATGGHGFLVWLPLKDLNPGRYLLALEARSRLDATTIRRETVITVK